MRGGRLLWEGECGAAGCSGSPLAGRAAVWSSCRRAERHSAAAVRDTPCAAVGAAGREAGARGEGERGKGRASVRMSSESRYSTHLTCPAQQQGRATPQPAKPRAVQGSAG